MKVRIYQPSRNTMQSARGRTRFWVLEGEIATPRSPDPLMGWTSGGDTHNQIRLRFDSKEEAVAYAERQGWDYSTAEAAQRRIPPRNYADAFRPDRTRGAVV